MKISVLFLCVYATLLSGFNSCMAQEMAQEPAPQPLAPSVTVTFNGISNGDPDDDDTDRGPSAPTPARHLVSCVTVTNVVTNVVTQTNVVYVTNTVALAIAPPQSAPIVINNYTMSPASIPTSIPSTKQSSFEGLRPDQIRVVVNPRQRCYEQWYFGSFYMGLHSAGDYMCWSVAYNEWLARHRR